MAWRDLFRWGRKAANAYDILRAISGASRSRSGRAVNTKTAIEASAVFGCSRVRGNGMAQVPLKLMREKTDARGRMVRVAARDHPLYNVLATKPNPWQTSFEFRETLSWHCDLAGRAIAFVNRSTVMKPGSVSELILFEPESVTVKRAADSTLDRTLTYEVRSPRGSVQNFPAEAIWHLRGPSWNGWDGMDPLAAAREAIGLALSIEEAQAGLHRNGVQSTGGWSVEGKLDEKQYKELRDWISREHVGAGNSGKPFIMDRAAKWMQTAMSGVDAQTLETRRFQIEEVCRFFNVMPIMVGYSDKATTYASSEQMFLAHLVHTLSPMWQRVEQSIDAYLLTEAERADGYYSNFIEEGMIRGSAKDTKDVILGYVNGGVLTPNEGRALLDQNPDDDPASDKLRIPVNAVQEPTKPAAGEGSDA